MKRLLAYLAGMACAGSLGLAAEEPERDLRELARELVPEETLFVIFRPLFDFTEGLDFGIVHIERKGDLVSYYLGTNPRMAAYAERTKGRSAVLGSKGAFGEMVEPGIWKGTSSMSMDDGHVKECALRFRVADRKLHENTCAGHVADTRVVEATEAGDLAAVERLIAEGAPLDQRSEQGHTALTYALVKDLPQIATLLVNGGATIGPNELIQAARRGDVELVKALIAAGAELDARADDGATALAWAAYHGHIAILEALLSAETPVNTQTKDGRTALYVAVIEGRADVVRTLLEAGADPTVAHEDGRTPLHVAKTPEIAGLLLEAGAEIELQTDLGLSPLTLAARYGRVEMVRFLLDKGVRADVRAIDGSNALILASYYGNVETVELLLAAEAPIDVQSNDGRTALMCAAGQGHVEIVRMLLEAGADTTLKDADGDTALAVAKDPTIHELLTP